MWSQVKFFFRTCTVFFTLDFQHCHIEGKAKSHKLKQSIAGFTKLFNHSLSQDLQTPSMQVDSTMENWFFLKNSHSDPLQCIWLHLMDDSKCKQGCAFLCLMPILKAGIQLGQWEQFWLDFYLSCWKIPRLKAQSKLQKKQRENMLWIHINSTFLTKFLLNYFQVINLHTPPFLG